MIKTFALIAHIALSPAQTDAFAIDTGLTYDDCLAAITQPVHEVEIGDGITIVIRGEQALSCEAE